MASDNVNDTVTGNPYEELRNTEIPFAERPKRVREVEDIKSYKYLGYIIVVSSFTIQGGGIILLSHHLGTPIVIVMLALWLAVSVILLFGVFNVAKSMIITMSHLWEDGIDSTDHFWIDLGAEAWEKWNEQALNANAYTAELIRQYQQHQNETHEMVAKQRGAGVVIYGKAGRKEDKALAEAYRMICEGTPQNDARQWFFEHENIVKPDAAAIKAFNEAMRRKRKKDIEHATK